LPLLLLMFVLNMTLTAANTTGYEARAGPVAR
jgi:hypothetical protein